MHAKLALSSLLIAACSSDPTPVDAPGTSHDAPSSVTDSRTADSPSVDAPASNVCTGKIYDACTGTTGNCMSGMCKAFNSAGFSVCTQACSASNPCPTQNGAAVPCNNMGICRPSAANACTPP